MGSTSQNKLMETPVHIAAANNCLHQLKDCLTPGLLAQRNITGTTAFEVAKQNNNDQVIDEKLQRQTKILLGLEKRTYDDAISELGLRA